MQNLTRRSLLVGMSTVAVADSIPTLAASAEPLVFTGGYTDQGSKSQGIYAYRWSETKGELTALGLAAATPNPSFLAVSPNRSRLYAVNEIGDYDGQKSGSVSAFSVDAQTGKLTLLIVRSSSGAGPCNINLDHTGKYALVANYDGGSAIVFAVAPDGKLMDSETIAYPGHGPNPDRQASAHAHCATATPDKGHVVINDLGLDCIHVYKLETKIGTATPTLTPSDPPAYNAIPNSGPRSLVFHPNGRAAYSTNELSNTLDVLAWDAAAGKLTRIQNLPTAANPGDTKNTAASVVIDREGKHVYSSNRGPENSIAHFRVTGSDGQLAFVERVDSGGQTPRHFALDPSGRWLIVANQGSNNLVVFKRNPLDGKIVSTGRSYPIGMPTCVLFA